MDFEDSRKISEEIGLIPLGVPPTPGMINSFFRDFKCHRCGRCCTEVRAPMNGIFLEPNEDEKLAKLLKVSLKEFKREYTFTQAGNRLMKYPCVFYNKEGCSIYSKRPAACRFYPVNIIRTDFGKAQLTLNPNCPEGRRLYEEAWERKRNKLLS